MLVLTIVCCKKEALKDYVTLSGTITNQNSDSLIVAQNSIIKKTIKVDAEGNFDYKTIEELTKMSIQLIQRLINK